MGRIALLGLVLVVACDRPAPSPATPGSTLPAAPVAASGAAAEPVGMKPMKKLEIRIGGCLAACRSAEAAVAGFVAAVCDAGDPALVVSFLDTAQLVLDGRALGARWAGQWNDLKTATRAAEIREAAESLSAWTRDVTPDQRRASETAGARPVRVWSTEAVFEFQPPGVPAAWTLVLRPRGLEWLIVEIRRGGPDAPPPAAR